MVTEMGDVRRAEMFEKMLKNLGGDIEKAKARLKNTYIDMYPTNKKRAESEFKSTIKAYLVCHELVSGKKD